MDADDSEKRIADLEYQLAERQRGTDLPSASPDAAPTSGRFLAFAAPAGSGRPSPRIAVDVGRDAISVIHLDNSASVVSARLGQVRAQPALDLSRRREG
jgi:hypothetical protein